MKRKNTVIITGSLGLIGYHATNLFLKKGYRVIGIDNGSREKYFNLTTGYQNKLSLLRINFSKNYIHIAADVTSKNDINKVFKTHGKNICLIIHTAAQTSHDWSGGNPVIDFTVNALGTLYLLEAFRVHSPKATFIFTSTNKIYGDSVNNLGLKEFPTRFDFDEKSKFYSGIDENLPIDQSTHSPFGVSKVSADLMVQEYGRYWRLKTGVFRLGVVSGGNQDGNFYQGFLSFLIKTLTKNNVFNIIGFQGKQVRDIIHAEDVVLAFYLFYKRPKMGVVYNLGGGRKNSVSIVELVKITDKLLGKKLKTKYRSNPRKGDHKWWISDCSKFEKDYPEWTKNYDLKEIILDIYSQRQ